jgi:SAM-dependent methyltransferase
MKESAGSFSARDPKTEVLGQLIRKHARRPIRRLLVVGCGSGLETAVLGEALRAGAVGVDLRGSFDPRAAAAAELRRGDATQLEFEDGTFDLVFSYHVLEHIPNYAKAISEMRRVTAKNGLCCIGTPNRQRLVGYLGSKDATWREKLVWNLIDWRARLRGRFKNELGAHAGFTDAELKAALGQAFAAVEDITLHYYLGVYRRQSAALGRLDRWGFGRYLFPAVYLLGRT